MAKSLFISLLVASVCCFYPTGTGAYSIHRIDNENGQPVNVEIDFYSSDETRSFLDSLKTLSKERDANRFNEGTEPTPGDNDSTPLDSWSVVWYIASFGGLIVFFLIVSCSEWCCRRAIRNNQNCQNRNTTTVPTGSTPVPDTPPPSYDQFAPPSYESICLGRRERGCEKSEYDIYVVPVHALGTIMETTRNPRRGEEDAPPSYLSASTGRGLLRLEIPPQSRVT